LVKSIVSAMMLAVFTIKTVGDIADVRLSFCATCPGHDVVDVLVRKLCVFALFAYYI